MIKENYYLKDKKISLWEYTTESIKGVTRKTYFSNNRRIWAYYMHNGGNGTITTSNTLKLYDENAAAIFVINRRPVSIGSLIIYNHKIYEITRIDDAEGYRTDLKLYAKVASNQTFSSYTGLEDD